MRVGMRSSVPVAVLAGVSIYWCVAVAGAEDYRPIPGLSTKDRAVLAGSMVQQGQCRNGLVEILEAMKEMPEDETLVRLKGICEADLLHPQAKDTILKWLKLAPQDHPDRSKMLTLLAKSQAPSESPIEWVLVPAGEFEMGAEGPPAEPDEAPKHRVHLDAFYIGKYEVTNANYAAFVKATDHRPPVNSDPSPTYNLWRGNTVLDGVADLPVVNVSWEDAAAYCKWLGGRLPTEAEWEKAARGTDSRTYPWGNEPVTGNRANYGIENVTFWEGPSTLAKKDQHEFGKSPYEVHEMAGNVWEWVQDWYDPDYYKNSPPKNPTGPATGQVKGVRGGSWQNQPDKLRSANRSRQPPADRRTYIGVRCAKDAKDSQ